mmetsp:Transcript_19251/g.35845  ORF Transcript_19251/g.35845 Transcript_19251/m.35845 type:complete len:204 (-) Transcript_19251:36-647(-)
MCLETLIDLREGRFQDPSFKDLIESSDMIFFNNASGWFSGEKVNPEKKSRGEKKKLSQKKDEEGIAPTSLEEVEEDDNMSSTTMTSEKEEDEEKKGGAFSLEDQLVGMVVNSCKIGTKLVTLDELRHLKPEMFHREEYDSVSYAVSWSDHPQKTYVYTLRSRHWRCGNCTCQEGNLYGSECCVACNLKVHIKRKRTRTDRLTL